MGCGTGTGGGTGIGGRTDTADPSGAGDGVESGWGTGAGANDSAIGGVRDGSGAAHRSLFGSPLRAPAALSGHPAPLPGNGRIPALGAHPRTPGHAGCVARGFCGQGDPGSAAGAATPAVRAAGECGLRAATGRRSPSPGQLSARADAGCAESPPPRGPRKDNLLRSEPPWCPATVLSRTEREPRSHETRPLTHRGLSYLESTR